MTIKKLKEIIKDLPDDMHIYADDGDFGMFSNNSEFVLLIPYQNMAVLQKKSDFDVNDEVVSHYNAAKKIGLDANTFWNEFYELGYDYDDFADPKMKEEAFDFLEKRIARQEG